MSTPDSPDTNAPPQPDPALKKKRNRALLKYGLARLGLFVLLTVVIQGLAYLIGAPVPLVISTLLALIVAFPLSMLIFRRLRAEATETVGELSRQRRAYREWVKQELAER